MPSRFAEFMLVGGATLFLYPLSFALRTTFGLGFMLNGPEIQLMGPTSFGHAGAGGSLGFADAASGVAFGYVMNQMGSGLLIDPRAARLIQSVKESLGL